MVGINLGDLPEILERVGVPAGLALVSLYFLVVYLRGERSQPSEPDWAMQIRLRSEQTDAHVRKLLTELQRGNDRQTDQLNQIQGMVQEVRTILRVKTGHRRDE